MTTDILGDRIVDPKQYLKEDFPVKVKVLNIKGDKMFLSMREVDQKSGEDLKAKRKANLQSQLRKAVFKDEKQGDGKVFGGITGIKLETKTERGRIKDRINSPDLWELSRLKYFAGNEMGVPSR
jgi:predicted RNA-binding protein with RPS1 domain